MTQRHDGDAIARRLAFIATEDTHTTALASGSFAGFRVAEELTVGETTAVGRSGNVTGSVTIADVRTYGIDTSSLFNDVTRWALDPRNREMLKHYGPSASKKLGVFSGTQYNHLRIVSRVYVTRRVIVSLRDTSARSGRVDSGLPDTADLFEAAAGGSPAGRICGGRLPTPR